MLVVVVLQIIFYLNVTNPTWDNIKILIEDGSLTNTGCVIIIKDKNFLTTTYSFEEYYVDQNVDGVWKSLPYVENNISNMLFYIPKHIPHTYEKILNWKNKYGELKAGSYRIRFEPNYFNKSLNEGKTLIIEFEII